MNNLVGFIIRALKGVPITNGHVWSVFQNKKIIHVLKNWGEVSLEPIFFEHVAEVRDSPNCLRIE
jgi:hypothetical protein